MRCPFPGMDPYLERPAIWADFHDSLIAAIRGILQPELRPRYAAVTQDRLYVVVFELPGEEVREPFLQIIEPAAGNRLVTAIEVLSPENKASGPGRRAYLKKRREFWDSGANLVEIDLLRRGRTTSRVSAKQLERLQPYRYLVTVTRCEPPQHEVYAFPLQRPLPRIAIPLAEDDVDIVLDLPAAFARCWDEGPYPELLHYEAEPPQDLDDAERKWCREMLSRA